MYSGEYDACDVTLSVYPHRASLKNMPDHGGNRTYDLSVEHWSYIVTWIYLGQDYLGIIFSVRVCESLYLV